MRKGFWVLSVPNKSYMKNKLCYFGRISMTPRVKGVPVGFDPLIVNYILLVMKNEKDIKPWLGFRY